MKILMPFDARQAKKIADLSAEDRHRDTGGKPDGDRPRDELDQRSEPEQPHQYQEDPG
ncbi:hypothetical protein D3C81_1277550 [compost metagenome]